MKSGVYKILNLINGKFYIGSAIYLNRRQAQHKHLFVKGCHHSIYLQRSWNKYGMDNFEFHVVEYIENATKEILLEREQFYLDTLKPAYNVNVIATNRLGTTHSEETRALMKLNHKGMTGRTHPEEVKNRMSASQKGKTNRDKTKWPHDDGYYCKCAECKEKRNFLYRLAARKRKAKCQITPA